MNYWADWLANNLTSDKAALGRQWSDLGPNSSMFNVSAFKKTSESLYDVTQCSRRGPYYKVAHVPLRDIADMPATAVLIPDVSAAMTATPNDALTLFILADALRGDPRIKLALDKATTASADKCLDIDPCDAWTSRYCCADVLKAQRKTKLSETSLMLVTTLVTLLCACVLLVLATVRMKAFANWRNLLGMSSTKSSADRKKLDKKGKQSIEAREKKSANSKR